MDFKITESKNIKGLIIIKPSVSSDIRGTIWTSYYRDDIDALLPEGLSFRHDKFSQSKKNVLRGIHGDDKTWKLVTTVYGEIYQVVVDLREESPTYMRWEGFFISKENQVSILVPPSFGNAYYALSDQVVYHYKLAYNDDYNDVNHQFVLKWNDKNLGIKWPTDCPILSKRDSFE
jgi:dTDP-4-dehydrorhamnose 3,5-epimerase